ncbi:unnamed protein product [Linum trigynum]|uniref:Endonuclease/exonuclease/phosphatase domain-containing protein n=1 Tax=Linum trigynum TaxID=586398 RepID=A0AAV2EN98_9ROSI
MRLLSYNCRGLGNTRAVRSLKSLLLQVSPRVVFLMETKQLRYANEKIRVEMGFKFGTSWPCDTSRGGRARGISLWWKEEINAQVMNADGHLIDLRIEERLEGSWRFTGVYGWPESGEKHQTLELIHNLKEDWNGPWLCGGHFNYIMTDAEKQGGCPGREREMGAFTYCLAEAGLLDLGFRGYPFTWENRRRVGGYIEERLDRFLANDGWRSMKLQARVSHLDLLRSDHRPIICDTLGEEDDEIKWGWSFQFESLWAKHEGCAEQIHEAWNSSPGDAISKLSGVQSKLTN